MAVMKRKKKTVARKAKAPRKVKAKTKRKSGLTQMMYTVSEELEEIVGAKRLTRPMIVKKVWVYIKAHKCQDAKKRRMINPDKKLGAVLGHKQIDMLKMAGALNKHIKK